MGPVDLPTQKLQAAVIALGHSSELDGKKIPLLKTSHTGVTEHGEIKPALTRKLRISWLAFIVLGGATHSTN